jgi:hypothetical protein
MPVDWRAEITTQLDFCWEQSLRPRLDGLTDDEYFWEPVEGCWTVRPAGSPPGGSILAAAGWRS